MVKRIFYGLTHWEAWHRFVKYIFIGPAWLWYCLRARSWWFFTPSNPTITFGGFAGESKTEIYRQLPLGTYPATALVCPDHAFEDVERLIRSHNLRFPMVAKPDVGQMGLMFRKIASFEQLRQYHRAMHVPYVIQEYVDHPVEVSVFYYRYPDETSGHITGFVRKDCLQVAGDGSKTLKELIDDYPLAHVRRQELYNRHERKLKWIVPAEETYVLSYALDLSRGGRIVSLEHEKDDALLRVFDNISHYTGSFFYGRYDIKCRSIEDLKAGRNFSILAYNGAGAEPHHVYGNGFTFIEACSILVRHWHIMFRIAAGNRKRGIPCWDHAAGRHFMDHTRSHIQRLKQLDNRFEFADSVETVIIPAYLMPFAQRYAKALAPNNDLV